MERFLLISLGAILGANARYWLADWAAQRWGASFPFGTLLINLSGSFLLGLFMVISTERLALDPRWRILFAVGFLGPIPPFLPTRTKASPCSSKVSGCLDPSISLAARF